jgi:hypothetical protein
MTPLTCPKCGHQASPDATACPDCGQALKNGAVCQPGAGQKPPPPPEVRDWVIHKLPPEYLEWARQTFNEEEFMAGLREVQKTGGLRLEDFIDELEEEVRRRERTNQ